MFQVARVRFWRRAIGSICRPIVVRFLVLSLLQITRMRPGRAVVGWWRRAIGTDSKVALGCGKWGCIR